jgi:hypothetical protein
METMGAPGPRTSDALITYRMPRWAIGELKAFLTDMLWMHINDEGGVA